MLGAAKRGEGYFEGGGYVVTWAIGHLVALAQPHEINPSWKHWSLATLPMLPEKFPLVVVPETKAQFAVVRRILKDRSVEHIVCATDAGREGELIFRYIYEVATCNKPVSRLWISSLTADAIRKGFRNLKSDSDYDALANAAKGRSRADWLVGMNLSRAYSLKLDQDISVGRVQTPTLAIVVERELAIRNFIPEDYMEVTATFATSGSTNKESNNRYQGTWFGTQTQSNEPANDSAKQRRLPSDGVEAQAIVARALAGNASVESVQGETRKIPPPLLYDLTELQRHANRLFAMSAQQTLNVAQSLYERHKLLSYPRTDSRHLSKDVATTLGAVVETIHARYAGCLAPGTGTKSLGSRFVDDTRVTDHHAIIPTATPPREGALSIQEQKVYDLVCRRLLEAWHEDHVYSITTVVTAITAFGPAPIVDHYASRGTAIERIGWKVLDIGGGKKAPKVTKKSEQTDADGSSEDIDDRDQALPPGLARSQHLQVIEANSVSKRTRPPKRHTEATLLTAMENAGESLDEKELSDAMQDLGLGTPATRAQIIETLLRREYLVRSGKSLQATDKGIGLVSVVHSEVKSPAMTGEWEAKLKRLQRGQGDLGTFMAGIEAYVTNVVSRVINGHNSSIVAPAPKVEPPPKQSPSSNGPTMAEPPAAVAKVSTPKPTTANSIATRSASTQLRPNTLETPPIHALASHPAVPRKPTAPGDLRQLLQSSFGFANFRPYQETVCRAATEGRDLLLVMPTGAGKSLCYQLPGIARAGTTLVVSPLIALMDDQAAKLTAQGFRVERIHSGRQRAQARQACIDYLAGHLDFLFIAPERLRVPGFPEMLAKRTPALIAIDEAHCISQWGHDFRPDYRLLCQRLPALRPAPIVALTATATPEVQNDIVVQLGLNQAGRFIHGFRRTNIAIEVVEMSPGQRADAVRELLADQTRRPAIVYTATRKSAEALGAALGGKRASAYHAGMDADERERIQSAFLDGRLEIIVATVAFGMGIDKANVRTIVHAALPGSLEGYYQEIGRAGRDGNPASAILMHSYADRKTHEFFHNRDYPDPDILDSIYKKLTKKPVDRDALCAKLSLDSDLFDRALEKLEIHGGAARTLESELVRGDAGWQKTYLIQRDHKLDQLHFMVRFAESHGCRMVHMIRHFGDQEDNGAPCGLCDACAPSRVIARRFREPSRGEAAALSRILATLARDGEQATGKLYRETFPDSEINRRSFEHLLAGLCRAGLVTVQEASFEKGGEQINYQRASLTDEGRQRGGSVSTGISLPKESLKSKLARSTSTKTKARAKTKAASKANAGTKAKTRSKWYFINLNRRAKKRAER